MRSTAIDRKDDSLAERLAFMIGKIAGLTVVFVLAALIGALIVAGLWHVLLLVKP